MQTTTKKKIILKDKHQLQKVGNDIKKEQSKPAQHKQKDNHGSKANANPIVGKPWSDIQVELRPEILTALKEN